MFNKVFVLIYSNDPLKFVLHVLHSKNHWKIEAEWLSRKETFSQLNIVFFKSCMFFCLLACLYNPIFFAQSIAKVKVFDKGCVKWLKTVEWNKNMIYQIIFIILHSKVTEKITKKHFFSGTFFSVSLFVVLLVLVACGSHFIVIKVQVSRLVFLWGNHFFLFKSNFWWSILTRSILQVCHLNCSFSGNVVSWIIKIFPHSQKKFHSPIDNQHFEFLWAWVCTRNENVFPRISRFRIGCKK